ncbi:penicillin-binding protein 2 [Flocculibacter collagenilyticus]|uniref:penicillin-binding protein 2 n=1 Tax=Flocculibacter collagenilyticus TaxID=2744479 RepID=UPI0018F3228C|nr:penicillin-binding protein 2 [Flocculibacter collagenilyticus]
MIRQRVTIKDHSAEANLFTRRTFITFLGVVCIMLLLISNLYQLQVTSHESYKTRSNENRIKVVPVAPNRGLIYDRNGVLLAENKPVFSLEIIPEKVGNLEDTLQALSTIIEISDEQKTRFLKAAKYKRRFKSIPIIGQLTETQVAQFSVNQHLFPGVSIEARLTRYYPHKETLTHVLGYVSKINKKDLTKLEEEEKTANYAATRDIGKLGLEKYYENELHGTVGFQEVEINNRGRILRTLKQVPPIPGKDIHLGIDIGLQKTAQKALKDTRGAVVAIDPRNGDVLALYSNPSYDPNLFVHGISGKEYKKIINSKDRPLINRTTQGRYPPASTIKPQLALLGLDENEVTVKTRIWDPGFFQLKNLDHKYRDHTPYGHGWVDIFTAIEKSCDIYFYSLAVKLGIDRISTFMAKFGFGEETGIDIHEENTAILPSVGWKRARYNQPWWAGDTVNIGIGQGYWTATPLQIATATTVLVNKGLFYVPRLVNGFTENDQFVERAIEEKPPVVLNDNKNWDPILTAMHNTVLRGSAAGAFKGAVYDSAGKTGTGQVISISQDEEYKEEAIAERHRDNAMYIGYAPYDDPQIVIAVTLENAGHGGTNAAPIARQIMDYYFTDRMSKQ